MAFICLLNSLKTELKVTLNGTLLGAAPLLGLLHFPVQLPTLYLGIVPNKSLAKKFHLNVYI
jgi:hypothetical protein